MKNISIRPKKIIVWLSSTTFFEKGRVGGFFFFFFRFFFQIKVKAARNYCLDSPNKGANKSTLPKNIFNTSLKPVLKCKQVENKKLKNIKRSKFSKKKKLFLEFWKLGVVYFCTVKTFFQFLKIRGGQGRTTKQLFFFFSALWYPSFSL